MAPKELSPELIAECRQWQKAEVTGRDTYARLATVIKDDHNREVVERIVEDEERHYQIFKQYTGEEIKARRWAVFFYYWLARLFGLTFGIKLMERGEDEAVSAYRQHLDEIPELRSIMEDEEAHEGLLIGMLDEEVLKYTGSVVLGLNDALVELTGTLAGLTFAFQNTRLIALSGLITGISAAFSMAASEYLSSRADEDNEDPARSALFTGLAYIFTVAVLVFPYLVLSNYVVCLIWTLANAILVIAVFNYYISVAKNLDFRKRFLEMAAISIGVAVFSFVVGLIVRQVFGIEV